MDVKVEIKEEPLPVIYDTHTDTNKIMSENVEEEFKQERSFEFIMVPDCSLQKNKSEWKQPPELILKSDSEDYLDIKYNGDDNDNRLTLNEILDQLELDDSTLEAEVIIQPPLETGTQDSDADSDKSDDENEGDLIHLPRRILSTIAETSMATEENNEPKMTQSSSRRGRNSRKWSKSMSGMKIKNETFPAKAGNTKKLSIIQCFHAMYPGDLLDLICNETNLYSSQKQENIHVTKEEVITFLGILILSGYNKRPSKRLFWSNDQDVHCQIVCDAMRRNRFEKIMQFLHLADNNKINEDRFYKVREMFSILNRVYKNDSAPECMSIDESMIPYYGKHGSKQFIRGKPIRFGFKLWCLATSCGRLIHAEPYCGASTDLPKTGMGQGSDVVLGLLEKCNIQKGSKLYFDNLFTSLPLLDSLSALGLGGAGTLRENRLQGAPIMAKKILQKKPRGFTDCAHDGKNIVVNWNDNKAVIIATNCHDLTEKHSSTRYDRSQKKRILVDLPNPLFHYNQGMGGVDLYDECVACYRVRIKSKKWWWALFAWGINSSLVNGWRLYNSQQETSKILLLAFIREIATHSLLTYGSKRARPGRPLSLLPEAAASLRFDGKNHWMKKLETYGSRCRHCNGRSVFACTKCNVPLHPQCQQEYHTN